ncbi:MAG TPA: type II toxin-antitoxin system antitoxin SocA domain-containing protein, partial [Longimicrobium sp.]|nr:type II toxin-antitoxin system antitoxin SocA domain-containing protein [Longimicrobium sp.]
VPDRFELPRDAFGSDEERGRTKALLDEIYDVFGQYSAWKLRNMTHEEHPWKAAYRENVNREITHAAMRDYFKDFVAAEG